MIVAYTRNEAVHIALHALIESEVPDDDSDRKYFKHHRILAFVDVNKSMFWPNDRRVNLANITTTLALATNVRFVTKQARSGKFPWTRPDYTEILFDILNYSTHLLQDCGRLARTSR
jgi:hypothetical protein